MGKKLWIDTETGGLDNKVNSLLTAAFVVTDENDEVLTSKEWKIKSKEYNVTPEAMTVNKINLKEHDKVAIKKEVVVKEMIDFIKQNFEGKPIVCGHSIKFDKGFINTLFVEEQESFYKYIKYKEIDTKEIAFILNEMGVINTKNNKLQNLLSEFNIQVPDEEKHDALFDILNTIKIYNHMKGLILK